jgi:iron complex transport system ATP-binding protein
MKALLEAKGLSLRGRLEETSLSLAAGELTCLVGPNGSGKTSLLHALAGIGAPSGTLLIDGVDPRSLPPAQRQRLFSYLPASREIHWPLSTRDLIALGASHGESLRRLPALLDELALTSFADRRVDRMSTGERSRVLIARALVSQPKVLLLDEPAANLDPLWQLRLMDYLRSSAARDGQAMLVAVHDLELARHYADRLFIMDKGMVAADGNPATLLEGPIVSRIFGIGWSEGRWRPLP